MLMCTFNETGVSAPPMIMLFFLAHKIVPE